MSLFSASGVPVSFFLFSFLFPSTVLIMKLASDHSKVQSRCGTVSFVHFPGCFSLFGALQKDKKKGKIIEK